MRRFLLPLAGATLCAIGLWGCGSMPTTIAGKPWLKRGVATSDRLEKQPSRNPLRNRGDSKPALRDEADDESRTAERGRRERDESSASQREQLAKFDPETLQLIEDELAASPSEERQDVFNVVLNMQPSMVKQFIHTRRVLRQMGQNAPHQFVTPEQSVGRGSNPIQLVAGEQGPVDGGSSNNPQGYPGSSQNIPGRDPSRDPGLGAVDPWNRKTQPDASSSNGSWSNDSLNPPAPLPFNQIPALPATGHSAGYT
ncbi:MAG: hypothetical protein KDA84_02200, partial [Planctomycetaceae bacterium]|nr:hypothetical protein [Planctomycetaceae bacterium]